LQLGEYFLIRAQSKKSKTSSHAESLSPVLEFAWAREINSVETLIFHFSSLSGESLRDPHPFLSTLNTKLVMRRATGLATK
jgi:hypothetical protein